MKPRLQDTPARTKHTQSAGQVFLIPAVLGLCTAVGLLSALFGDGEWDALSWVTVCVPIAVVGWAWRKRL